MNGHQQIEALAYVVEALRRQEARYRSNHWPVPAAVVTLVDEIGFRVSRGQDGSRHDALRDNEERVSQGPKLLVRYETAAQLLEVSVSTIKRLIKAGELHPVGIGGASRLRRTEIEAYVNGLASTGGN